MSWLFGAPPKKQQEQTLSPEKDLSLDPHPSQLHQPSSNSTVDIQSILNSQYLDPAKLHPLAGLDKDIEYLDLDDEKLNTVAGTSNGLLPSRGWSDDLCYGAGTVYVMGLGVGGFKGINEGLKQISTNTKLQGMPFKLKLNTILNQVTKHGPHLGNSAGVLAIYYNIIDSSLDAYRGVHDDYNSLAAGFISGLLFKSTKGLKAMGYSSVLMTLGAATWCGLKGYVTDTDDKDARFK